jgi:hypothetical protein
MCREDLDNALIHHESLPTNSPKAMQAERHKAGYDPFVKFKKSEVEIDISTVESAIGDFAYASVADRKAFAAWVLIKNRAGQMAARPGPVIRPTRRKIRAR